MSVIVIHPEDKYHVNYWDGAYSKMGIRNAIETYVIDCLKASEKDTSLIIEVNDGIESIDSYNNTLRRVPPGTNPIVGTLCTRYTYAPRILYLPLDDEIFTRGLLPVLSSVPRPVWETRHPIVFWRGGASGGYPSARSRTVDLCNNYKYADVKLTIWGDWHMGKPIPTEHFSDRCGLEKHFKYKYICIIDGNVIASNHQWVFGSGAVPIMITHPENNWWFKKHLKPMINYVPIQYDLSDLKEKIEWLVANDDKAKAIMENAMELSATVLSHEGQAAYLKETIHGLVNGTATAYSKFTL